MNRLIDINNAAVKNVPVDFERYLVKEISWNTKLILN